MKRNTSVGDHIILMQQDKSFCCTVILIQIYDFDIDYMLIYDNPDRLKRRYIPSKKLSFDLSIIMKLFRSMIDSK